MIMFNAIEFNDGRSGRNTTGEFPNACKGNCRQIVKDVSQTCRAEAFKTIFAVPSNHMVRYPVRWSTLTDQGLVNFEVVFPDVYSMCRVVCTHVH